MTMMTMMTMQMRKCFGMKMAVEATSASGEVSSVVLKAGFLVQSAVRALSFERFHHELHCNMAASACEESAPH